MAMKQQSWLFGLCPHIIVCYANCVVVHVPLHVVLAVKDPPEESLQNNWNTPLLTAVEISALASLMHTIFAVPLGGRVSLGIVQLANRCCATSMEGVLNFDAPLEVSMLDAIWGIMGTGNPVEVSLPRASLSCIFVHS